MKKFNTLLILGSFLIFGVIISTGCKKKAADPIVPAFTVTAVPVTFQTGEAGLQFFGKCNNDDVKMTKAIIQDPLSQQTTTFNLNGNYFIKNEAFDMLATNTGYVKELGTWSFTFSGNRTADGTAFNVGATLNVSGK